MSKSHVKIYMNQTSFDFQLEIFLSNTKQSHILCY